MILTIFKIPYLIIKLEFLNLICLAFVLIERKQIFLYSHLGSNAGLSSVSGNNSVYGTLGNSVSSSSSVYQQPNQGQSIYNPNGINQQGQYPHSNYSNLQSSYGISSSQSTGNIYGGAYPSSSQIITPNDLQSSPSWNQYATNLPNGGNQTAYDPNMYYAPYYANLFAQQYYQPPPPPQQQQPPPQQQQQQGVNQSQGQVPIEQTISPNGYPTSSNGGLEKNYQHISR
jgi:hypothetical protein